MMKSGRVVLCLSPLNMQEQYNVVRCIGKGAFGVASIIQDKDTGRRYVLKVSILGTAGLQRCSTGCPAHPHGVPTRAGRRRCAWRDRATRSARAPSWSSTCCTASRTATCSPSRRCAQGAGRRAAGGDLQARQPPAHRSATARCTPSCYVSAWPSMHPHAPHTHAGVD